jgi:hypothetical protein
MTLWAILNSNLVLGLVVTGLGWIWKNTVKKKSRREIIMGYADDLFEIVEIIGKEQSMSGTQKWTFFFKKIVDTLKEEKMGELSGAESAMLQNLAFRKAWLKKSPNKAIPVQVKKEP